MFQKCSMVSTQRGVMDTRASAPPPLRMCALIRARTSPKPESLRRNRYGALWRLAGWIAHDLQRQGVGPEDRVGLHLDRGVLLVAAMIGTMRPAGGGGRVLKDGIAYLPPVKAIMRR